jgi:hypothetical protein
MEEIKPENLEDYLKLEFKKAWITAAWLEGCLCLRCHPEGVWAVWENVPKSWCPICGKDPLMHGPEYKPVEDPNFILPNRLKVVKENNHDRFRKID